MVGWIPERRRTKRGTSDHRHDVCPRGGPGTSPDKVIESEEDNTMGIIGTILVAIVVIAVVTWILRRA
jgi:hypothetical protein